MTTELCLFETAIGPCAIVWGPDGIVGVQLPEQTEAATSSRLARRHPEAQPGLPPPSVRAAIDGIVALLRGEAVAFGSVALDLQRVPAFDRSVYTVTRAIPVGATLTYGAIAAEIGAPGSAQAVGRALGRNPFPIIIPCHRVLAAGGKAGGFSAPGGLDTKRRMLAIESVHAPQPEMGQGAFRFV
jgi:methylated-DNA-[protein]-cysteine S-methyltransferase